MYESQIPLAFCKAHYKKKGISTAQCHITITVNSVGLSVDTKVLSPAPVAMK